MLIRSTSRVLSAIIGALLVAGAAGCADDPADAGDARPSVVTAFYPLQFIAERIGGDAVTVSNLVKPGVEPHDLELTIGQVAQIADAGLIVYLKGFQPAVDEAVAQEGGERVLDVAGVQPLLDATAGGHEHEGEPPAGEAGAATAETGAKDPHVWLDPTRLATIGDRLAERLGRVDTSHAADFTSRAQALRAELTALDQEYAARLRTCQRREIVTSHAAFGYLAERYRLEQVAISGLTPDSDPSAQRVAEVAEEAREHDATTIFFETLVSPKTAETIAREVGARTAVLDPLEGLPPGSTGDYVSVMRTNLAALTAALGCA